MSVKLPFCAAHASHWQRSRLLTRGLWVLFPLLFLAIWGIRALAGWNPVTGIIVFLVSAIVVWILSMIFIGFAPDVMYRSSPQVILITRVHEGFVQALAASRGGELEFINE